ncbi:unnamed protein product [Hapterophycus canaliculatus]
MAELGDLLTTRGSTKQKDVTVEMLDYDFLDKCTDPDLIRAITRKLKSGEEGIYPDLVKHAEARLLERLPRAERSRILRMKAEPRPEEIHEAIDDLHGWEEKMALMSTKIKKRNGQQSQAPKWTSCHTAEIERRAAKVVRRICITWMHRKSWWGALPKYDGAYKKVSVDTLLWTFCRAWERFDADKEIEKLEKEEEDEQLRKSETITSVKVRVEKDRLRRAKKREYQLREEGNGRFKGILSTFEKKRAAERERAKGNESFKVKEYDEAFRCYTCSLALDDANARVYNNRAAAAHQMERFEEAEDDCTRAISLDPDFKKAWMRRGMVRHSRGKYAGSIADFTEVLRLDPDEKHATKLLEHSRAKQREVEGEAAGQPKGNYLKKRGRIFIEEVNAPPGDDGKHSMMCIPTRLVAAAPPSLGSKKTLVAEGWMQRG